MCCNMSSPHALFNTHTARRHSSTNACPLLDNMPDPKQGALSQNSSIKLPMPDWLPTAANGRQLLVRMQNKGVLGETATIQLRQTYEDR